MKSETRIKLTKLAADFNNAVKRLDWYEAYKSYILAFYDADEKTDADRLWLWGWAIPGDPEYVPGIFPVLKVREVEFEATVRRNFKAKEILKKHLEVR